MFQIKSVPISVPISIFELLEAVYAKTLRCVGFCDVATRERTVQDILFTHVSLRPADHGVDDGGVDTCNVCHTFIDA